MKNSNFNAILFSAVIAITSSPAMARVCDGPAKGPAERIDKFTNYAPSAGGINGRCGTSASGRNACSYFLEDHISGSTPAVMGAVPQRGGSSKLFGGAYRGRGIERAVGSSNCITVIAGDRYGSSSNNKFKMDVVTRNRSSNLTDKVNRIPAGNHLIPLGRMADLVPPSRKVKRKK